MSFHQVATFTVFSIVAIASVACGKGSDADPGTDGDTGTNDTDEAESAKITHAFGEWTLEPSEEIDGLCVSWTLDNEKSLYVQEVQLSNLGAFHHSNWFVVPESMYEGEDGYWDCDERDFAEIKSARSGTVLFAQSTQSWAEEQRLSEGAVIKIPPHHKIVAGLHMLNAAPREHRTNLWMTLELIHPRDVDVVVTPFRLSYLDLQIPPMTQSRFTGECDFRSGYESTTGTPFDLQLHWVLPHYHYLGNYFSLAAVGGPKDGELLYEHSGFNAEGNGRRFDPPLDLTGTEALRFTCGYDNWRDVEIGWGIGDQEMCVMLGLAESKALLDGSVGSGTSIVDSRDGTVHYEGDCFELVLDKNENQNPPSKSEREGPLYVPPVDPSDEDLPPVPECVDADPDAMAESPVTLSSIRENVFAPYCTYSACHGEATSAAAGLHLGAADLHAELMGHEVVGNTDRPLVDPQNPEGSWLYRLISRCDPTDQDGNPVSHMPRNTPVLLPGPLVGKVRAWIEAGAADD